MTLQFIRCATPIGELVCATEGALLRYISNDAKRFLAQHPDAEEVLGESPSARAGDSVVDFLSGRDVKIAVAYEAKGTDFQKLVWNELLKIPYGSTSTYTEIAERIGRPRAFRAVANACGQNPLPLLIPCHRVVHKSGNVSGFAWGVDVKKQLLALEANYNQGQKAA